MKKVLMFVVTFLITLYFKRVSNDGVLLDISDNFVTDINQCKTVRLEEVLADKAKISKQEISEDLNKMLGKLPSKIQEILKSYTIIVTERDVSVLYALDTCQKRQDGILAFADLRYHFIVCDAKECGYRDSLYHEIAHVVSYQMGYLSSTKEFTEIYDKEKDLFESLNTYKKPMEGKTLTILTNTQDEYFAEAFSMFVLSPTKLGENCPETFNYMVSLFYD